MAEALKAIEQQRTFAAKEDLVPTVIATHEQAAFILAEWGDLAGSTKHIEAASRMVEESALPIATKESARLRMSWRAPASYRGSRVRLGQGPGPQGPGHGG